MIYSVLGLIGIKVSSDYKWLNTLILETPLAKKCSNEEYSECKRFIVIDYAPKINLTNYREISKGLYIAENSFYDGEYGVEITLINSKEIHLKTSQECNEWLVILLQLHLIQEDYLLIHSAGLVKNNAALLLPSWGGVGKTACVVKLIKQREYNLLGDDLVAINKSGIAKAFLKDMVIYSYHKNLFPEVFKGEGNKKPIIPVRMNKFVSQAIPYIKPILRKSPKLLSFLRKNNPQSVIVSPKKIFNSKYIGGEGKIKRLIWLERVQTLDKYSLNRLTVEQMISKILSVSVFEIFNTKIEAICVLCGCGLLDYRNVFIKPYHILSQAVIDSETFILKLPVNVSIDNVSDILLEAIDSIRRE